VRINVESPISNSKISLLMSSKLGYFVESLKNPDPISSFFPLKFL
jgi:hypothetical protein